MIEWLVGTGVALALVSLMAGIPCAVGWILDTATGERHSWAERWMDGAFVLVSIVLCTLGPWTIGKFILGATSGG